MRRAGVTLIELVVSLTVIGLVSAAGYAALGWMAEARRGAAESTDAVARAAAVRRSLGDWLGGARLTIEEDGVEFRGVDGERDGAADDELTFLTTAGTPLGEGETMVRLFVDRDERTPERGVVAELTDRRRGDRRRVMEVEPGATQLEVRYLTGVGGSRRWVPSWISTTVLPAGVEVRIGAEQEDGLPSLLRLPLLVPLSGGV